jgi:hypothetical protein
MATTASESSISNGHTEISVTPIHPDVRWAPIAFRHMEILPNNRLSSATANFFGSRSEFELSSKHTLEWNEIHIQRIFHGGAMHNFS